MNGNKRMAYIDWFHGFIIQNPNLSIRNPEGCSLSRATYFYHHNVSTFFTNLEEVLKCVLKTKRIDTKGNKVRVSFYQWRTRCLGALCCIISSGSTFLPLQWYFPECMISNAPPGTLGLAAKTGWINSKLFLEVIKYFIWCLSSKRQPPKCSMPTTIFYW